MQVRVMYSSATPHESLEDQIANCIRSGSPTLLSDAEILDQCIQEKKWGAFEMVNVCLEIDTTHTHLRTVLRFPFSVYEGSPRADFFIRPKEDEWGAKQQEVAHLARQSYMWAIQHGISKEEARSILPENILSSKWYVNGSIRTWMQYIQETPSKLAAECVRVLEPLFPRIHGIVSR
jgi:thymidylate synthase ThyX